MKENGWSEKSRKREENLGRVIFAFLVTLGLLVGIGLAVVRPGPEIRIAGEEEGTDGAAASEAGVVAGGPTDETAGAPSSPVTEDVAVEPEEGIAAVTTSPEPAGIENDGTNERAGGPSVPEPITYEEAESAYRAGEYDSAARLFAAYTVERPENMWGFYMLGLSLWKNGDLAAAEDALGEAIAIRPDHVKSRINLARVLLDEDRAGEALEHAAKAVELEPENGDAYRTLGRAYHSLDRPAEAEEAYRQALGRNGDDAWALNNLGLLLIEGGRYEEAIGPLARAVAIDADEAVIQNNLGAALERTGHYGQAAESYARAVEIDPGHERAAVSLARVSPLDEADALARLDLAAIAEAWSAAGEDSAARETEEESETEKEVARTGP